MNPTGSQPCVTLELTGPLERLIGQGVVDLPLSDSGRLGEILAALVDRYPDAQGQLAVADELRLAEGPLPAGFLVIRDAVAVAARLETPVNPGDRLTLLSLISGG
jgi:molybdopterin converting factor small subunit